MRRTAAYLVLAFAFSQVYHPTATLRRGAEEVVVEKTSPDDQGLAWIEERDGGVLFIFYDPPPYRVTARLGEGAVAFASLALVDQSDRGGGTVLLSAGEARYLEAEDRVHYEIQEAEEAVEVKRGELRVTGVRLDYDNESGLARLKGPVRFTRAGKNPLSGRANELYYRVETGSIWLIGNVQVEQGERRTEAELARFDEGEGTAYLEGEPVRSQAPGERVEGRRVFYDLDTGEIWVLEGVTGVFSD